MRKREGYAVKTKKWKAFLAALLIGVLAGTSGCGSTINSSEITRLDTKDGQSVKADDSKEKNEKVEALKESNELPEDGIITQAQMETISGKDGTYEFYATDEKTGIKYIWSYEGKKIQNPVEQNLKVTFTEDEAVEEVKKAANNATAGLGFTLEKVNLAAPAKLTFTIPSVWEADTVILVKMVDKKPEKMSDATLSFEKEEEKDVTKVTINVTEMGDTYYLVGGVSKVSSDSDSSKKNETAGKKEAEKKSDDKKKTNDASNGQTDSNLTDEQSENQESGSDENEQTSSGEEQSSASHTCTLSIECSTILNNMDSLKSSKKDFVPSDGWIMAPTEVEYTPGESVYDVLYRICKENKIQIDANYTPAYGAYYVKGINQLYEFDCGELSGWMFSVNGWFPNYGCSKYEVSDGDVIEWRYTCDLGRDVGDQYYE